MTWRQRHWQSKYGNRKTEYNGIKYDSKKEAEFAQQLDLLKRAGEVRSWERQKRISLDINGYHICNYYIDFVVTCADGVEEYVEVKGFETEVWRLKWKLFEALWADKPDVRLIVIK